jgi:hypothetical protein
MLNDMWFGRSGDIGYCCPGCGERAYWQASTKTAHRFIDNKKYTEFSDAMWKKANA